MPTASKLYDRPDGRAVLAEDLGRQILLCHGDSAAAVAAVARVVRYEPGEELICQDGPSDHCLFFILEGRVKICASKREIRIREARCHVGELGCIDPRAGRSADVIAIDPCEVAIITAEQFRELAEVPEYRLWRRLAETLSDRLREHTKAVRLQNDRPHIFIGSSSELLPIAHALERGLNAIPDLTATTWAAPDIFKPSRGPMESLEDMIKTKDFMVLVAGAEDRTISRGTEQISPRDNIVLEIGLGMGALDRHRTFIVTPKSKRADLKLPTDLIGLTTLAYDDGKLHPTGWRRLLGGGATPSEADLDEAVRDVCGRLADQMLEDGPF